MKNDGQYYSETRQGHQRFKLICHNIMYIFLFKTVHAGQPKCGQMYSFFVNILFMFGANVTNVHTLFIPPLIANSNNGYAI